MNQSVIERPVDVLLAEDNPADVWLTREALKGLHINLCVVANGVDALAFMRRSGKFSGAARPALVLLDLNLPKKDGRQVLAEMRTDPDLDCIPVVVLTTSDGEDDIVHSYKLRANGFVTKPAGPDQFIEVIRSIEQFWIRVAKLPPHCRSHG